MKRCITYCVYMASHTGLLTDTSICRFIWVVQKHTGRQDAGGEVLFFCFFIFQVWMWTLLLLLQTTSAAFLQAFVVANKHLLCYIIGFLHERTQDKLDVLHKWGIQRSSAVTHRHLQNTCAFTPGLVPRSSTCLCDSWQIFWGGAEYLQLHFYPQQRRHAALIHNAPAGPVLKVVCNLFLRCTLVLWA